MSFLRNLRGSRRHSAESDSVVVDRNKNSGILKSENAEKLQRSDTFTIHEEGNVKNHKPSVFHKFSTFTKKMKSPAKNENDVGLKTEGSYQRWPTPSDPVVSVADPFDVLYSPQRSISPESSTSATVRVPVDGGTYRKSRGSSQRRESIVDVKFDREVTPQVDDRDKFRTVTINSFRKSFREKFLSHKNEAPYNPAWFVEMESPSKPKSANPPAIEEENEVGRSRSTNVLVFDNENFRPTARSPVRKDYESAPRKVSQGRYHPSTSRKESGPRGNESSSRRELKEQSNGTMSRKKSDWMEMSSPDRKEPKREKSGSSSRRVSEEQSYGSMPRKQSDCIEIPLSSRRESNRIEVGENPYSTRRESKRRENPSPSGRDSERRENRSSSSSLRRDSQRKDYESLQSKEPRREENRRNLERIEYGSTTSRRRENPSPSRRDSERVDYKSNTRRESKRDENPSRRDSESIEYGSTYRRESRRRENPSPSQKDLQRYEYGSSTRHETRRDSEGFEYRSTHPRESRRRESPSPSRREPEREAYRSSSRNEPYRNEDESIAPRKPSATVRRQDTFKIERDPPEPSFRIEIKNSITSNEPGRMVPVGVAKPMQSTFIDTLPLSQDSDSPDHHLYRTRIKINGSRNQDPSNNSRGRTRQKVSPVRRQNGAISDYSPLKSYEMLSKLKNPSGQIRPEPLYVGRAQMHHKRDITNTTSIRIEGNETRTTSKQPTMDPLVRKDATNPQRYSANIRKPQTRAPWR